MKVLQEGDIYGHLKWLRRVLIAVLVLAGYLFYLSLDSRQSLTELGMVAFAGTLQFLPALLATPYWARANRIGLLAGLLGGLGFWFFTMMLPMTQGYLPNLGELTRYLATDEQSLWSAATMVSLLVNLALFITVSLLTSPSEEERIAAEICAMDPLARSCPWSAPLSLLNAWHPPWASARQMPRLPVPLPSCSFTTMRADPMPCAACDGASRPTSPACWVRL